MSGGPVDLDALQQALAAAQHPRERAAVVGQLLAALGEPLRRNQPCPEAALGALARADVEGWLAVVDTAAVRTDLQRAAEAALESLLAEGEAERAEWEAWALEALGSRDALDRALVALARWGAGGASLSEPGRRALERLTAELARVDGAGPGLARRLVAVNAGRRARRDRLSGEHRERAWWFTARADCDALTRIWTDPEVAEDETAHCLDCARDRHEARLAARPPEGCVTEDELWKLDLGELPPARRRLVERHALRCGECALALQAVALPLHDGAEEAPPPARPVTSVPEVVASRPEFRVLLFRRPRPRLVVEPEPGVRLVAASLQLPAAAALHATRGSAALELELGPARAGQRGRLRVEVAGSRPIDLEVGI